MKITTRKDGEGYLAEVVGKDSLFAFAMSEDDAVEELKNVVDMMLDYYTEELSFQKKVKNFLLKKKYNHAV